MIVVTTPAGNIGQQTLCGILDSGEMPLRPRAGLGSTGDSEPAAVSLILFILGFGATP
jgi:hypothetical protein